MPSLQEILSVLKTKIEIQNKTKLNFVFVIALVVKLKKNNINTFRVKFRTNNSLFGYKEKLSHENEIVFREIFLHKSKKCDGN